MVPKLLIAAGSSLDQVCIDKAIERGVDVRLLDCFEDTHSTIQKLYPNRSIHVPAHRISVKEAVQSEAFDVAVIREEAADFVKFALLTQTLRDAHVRHVVVVCSDAARIPIYRRCGAHQVFVSDDATDVWQMLEPYLPMEVSAS